MTLINLIFNSGISLSLTLANCFSGNLTSQVQAGMERMAVENNSMGAIGNEMQMAQKKGIQTLPDGKATSRLKQLISRKDFGN